MKIKAYTLMEVTIAMLLSAICIGICYSAYDIIGKYYAVFHQKNESADVLLTLRQVMEKDVKKANIMIKMDEGVLCKQDSANVAYLFMDGKILRQIENLRTDTFKIAWKDYFVGFEGAEVMEADTLDQIKFTLEMDRQVFVSLFFSKHYSSHNLFH